MNIVARFNQFFGISHYYMIFYKIYKSGRVVNVGSAQWYSYKKSNVTGYKLMRKEIIAALEPAQQELLELDATNLIITGITYLGYFKVKK